MRAWFGTLVFTSFIFAAGCGSGPKYKVDDALLADVPVAEKEQILRAKSEIDTATEEKNKAQNDLAVTEKDVSVADSELGQYKLEVTKVKHDAPPQRAGRRARRCVSAAALLSEAGMAGPSFRLCLGAALNIARFGDSWVSFLIPDTNTRGLPS